MKEKKRQNVKNLQMLDTESNIWGFLSFNMVSIENIDYNWRLLYSFTNF